MVMSTHPRSHSRSSCICKAAGQVGRQPSNPSIPLSLNRHSSHPGPLENSRSCILIVADASLLFKWSQKPRVYIYMYICIYKYTCLCMYSSMYVCICIYIYKNNYIYIYPIEIRLNPPKKKHVKSGWKSLWNSTEKQPTRQGTRYGFAADEGMRSSM